MDTVVMKSKPDRRGKMKRGRTGLQRMGEAFTVDELYLRVQVL